MTLKGFKHTEDSKEKMSKSHRGKVSPLKGKKLSEETKRKMREAQKGKLCGLRSRGWKGGRVKIVGGYIKVYNPTHFNARSGGYILEHVLVVSNFLGRPLTKEETIHHKNGIRDDNRLENLELWTGRHPVGQRVEDKIRDSIEFLKQYGYKVTKE